MTHPSFDLERLYDCHAQSLFAFLLNLTRNEEESRDLLQEMFIKLATRPELMQGVKNERSFLLRLCHNMIIDSVRRRSARQRRAEALMEESKDLFSPAPNPDEQIFRDSLSEALGELPPEQRAVIHLKLWERLTFEAIAELLELPLNTVASRYRYGLDKLRQRLRPLYEELQ